MKFNKAGAQKLQPNDIFAITRAQLCVFHVKFYSPIEVTKAGAQALVTGVSIRTSVFVC